MLCKACLINKPVEDFPVRNDRSNRSRPYCFECSRNIQRARYKNHRRTAPFKHRCSRAKSRAQALKVPFDLTPDYLESIWTGICPAFKISIKWETEKDDEFAAELDRFKPELGYVKGNVTFLSRKANRIKNNVTLGELQSLVEWMQTWK